MRHLKLVQKLKALAPEVAGLRAMLLVGSCSRGTHTPNSDINIQLLVSGQFEQDELSQLLLRAFEVYGAIIRHSGLRGKLMVYFRQYPKIDIEIYT